MLVWVCGAFFFDVAGFFHHFVENVALLLHDISTNPKATHKGIMATQALPKGSFPTMITPFIEEGEHAGEIDYPIVKRLVNWYIASGCAGIFSPCLSSEMYDLKPEERLELSRFIKETIDGRCALVSTGT